MAAYVIVEIVIEDPVRYEEYKRLAGPTIPLHGGRYLARGGASAMLEGEHPPARIVVLEFPSAAKARAWWDSPEYAPAKRIRQECASARMIVVDGVSP